MVGEFVDGKWYYYNARREKSTGFIHLQTNSYYLDDDGVMMTGWQKSMRIGIISMIVEQWSLAGIQ